MRPATSVSEALALLKEYNLGAVVLRRAQDAHDGGKSSP
jgi:hypothetical protein